MSANAKNYFNKLNKESTTGKLQVQFDFYYLCLIAGFINGKISENIGDKFVDDFPSTSFFPQRDLIVGLLIAAEIDRNEIDTTDRKRIEKLMVGLVKSDSPTHMSEKGERLMNQYAQGGFEYIAGKIPSIYNLNTFLVRYYDEIVKTKKE